MAKLLGSGTAVEDPIRSLALRFVDPPTLEEADVMDIANAAVDRERGNVTDHLRRLVVGGMTVAEQTQRYDLIRIDGADEVEHNIAARTCSMKASVRMMQGAIALDRTYYYPFVREALENYAERRKTRFLPFYWFRKLLILFLHAVGFGSVLHVDMSAMNRAMRIRMLKTAIVQLLVIVALLWLLRSSLSPQLVRVSVLHALSPF